VAKGTAQVRTVSGHELALGTFSLDYNRTYYWKVNEVNEAAATPSWEGDVWSFNSAGSAIVDNFESYDDTCNRIYFNWIDGYGVPSGPAECQITPIAGNGTGSTVGNPIAPFAERTIVSPLSGGWQVHAFCVRQLKDTVLLGDGAGVCHPPGLDPWQCQYPEFFILGASRCIPGDPYGWIVMNGTGTDIGGQSDQFRFGIQRP